MSTIDCRDCAHCANDPDGLWCSQSLAKAPDARPFGYGIRRARSLESQWCGPDALLFEQADDKLLEARGRLAGKALRGLK
jgi:hypothetical protein